MLLLSECLTKAKFSSIATVFPHFEKGVFSYTEFLSPGPHMRCKHKHKKLIGRDISINIRMGKKYQTLRVFNAYAYVYIAVLSIRA